MASEGIWKTVRGRLQIASGDEFERTALHYLRVIWPSMIQAPRTQRLDRFGVDLCVPDDGTHFHVVVQTKGLKVDEQLIESQVTKQILPSIEKYRRSPISCDDYVLLHNREGSDRKLAGIIQEALDQLVKEGKAKSAQLWDRDFFIKNVRNQIDNRIRDKLSDRSHNLLHQYEKFFYFGNLFVSHVPLSHKTWKPSSPIQQEFDESEFTNTNAAKLIASPRKVRYALLIGSFGIGKTTTVLRAVDEKAFSVVYIPAHTIQRAQGSQGTNYLLRNINNELDLLDDLPADTAEVLRDIMGAVLGRILRQANDQFVLVIDGLDEHSFYGSAYGLNWLTNELSDLRCPIVLTTRKGHFLSLIGNYELAAQTLSRKGGAERIVEVFELGAWTPVQAQELLLRAISLVKSKDQALSIHRLLNQLTSDSSKVFSRLLSHPLFLQMTLDLIMDGEEWLVEDEDKLIEIWVRKKIQRDLSAPRLNMDTRVDADYYIESMIELMTCVALEMLTGTGSGEKQVLLELIDVDRVLAIARDTIGIPQLDAATLFTTSLLIPAGRRRGRILKAKFFHQAIQDFFLRRCDKSY